MDSGASLTRIGHRLVNAFEDDQHFFESVVESAGRKVDLLEGLARTDRDTWPTGSLSETRDRRPRCRTTRPTSTFSSFCT